MATVLVTGVDTPIGLGIARELGRHGLPVIGLSSEGGRSIGKASKYVGRVYPRGGGRRLADVVADVCVREKITEIIAIAEGDILALNAERERFPEVRFCFSDAARLQRALNKNETYEVARKVGIDTPSEWMFADVDEALHRLAEIEFPVVLKWANPQRVLKKLSALGLTVRKAEYCYSRDELAAALSAYRPLGEVPLIQAYCRGRGLGQFFYMKEGRACLKFQHERLREWPPEGGFSTVCRSLPTGANEALMRKSEALLAEMEWDGVAMVEYRYDERSGVAWLMEVNGRFWGSYPLAVHCGAEFAWYLVHNGTPPQESRKSEPTPGLICRYMVPETKRLIRVMFGRAKLEPCSDGWNPISELAIFCLSFLNPRMRYFIFSADDVGPFLRDVANIMSRLTGRAQ